MFKPLHDMVTLVLDTRETVTQGGIHLPDTHARNVRKATVHQVSAMASDKMLDLIKPGTRVLVAQRLRPVNRQGQMVVDEFPVIRDGDAEVSLVTFEDILGILDEEGHCDESD